MIWRWGPFVIFCAFLIFTGWLSGFLMPRWFAVTVGAVIGLISGLQSWFEEPIRPRRF
jgi:hypothetical protein